MPAYKRYKFDATAGRPTPRKRGATVGSSHDDVVELQTVIKTQTTAISVVVDACKSKLDATTLAGWYDLAKRSVVYVSTAVPLVIGIDAMATQGQGLVTELTTWNAKLAAAGCTNLPAPPPLPPPPPTPGGGFLEEIEKTIGSVSPIVLLGLAYLLVSKFK
jgi:hypothetical protein